MYAMLRDPPPLAGHVELWVTLCLLDFAQAIAAWQHFAQVFAKRLGMVLEQALWVESRPSFRILTMQTQWGSCSPRGQLTLNPHLVKAPNACIDYVIVHELCHLAEHNHSKRFYMLLGQVMPDWERVKMRLDGLAQRLF